MAAHITRRPIPISHSNCHYRTSSSPPITGLGLSCVDFTNRSVGTDSKSRSQHYPSPSRESVSIYPHKMSLKPLFPVGLLVVAGCINVVLGDDGPDPRKVDTSGASYAALVHVAEVSVSKTSGATRLHQECRRRVLQAHAPPEDVLPAGHRIVKDLPITQHFPL